ncbi:P-loop containing nucleoside triphosphate hydrolase protein, partial [Pelagophyceae sp. CCMP2097]
RRLLASRRLSSHDVAELGVSHVRGALLYGPPGCGKTLLARHVAAALGCDEDRVSVVNGPELLDKFVGVAEERVRALFDRPKAEWARYVIKTAGAVSDDASGFKRANVMPKINVVIFDEIDAICRKRGSLADSTGVRDSVTAQLLASIDGVEDAGNLIVLATTNMPELLDPALLRPGRLEV